MTATTAPVKSFDSLREGAVEVRVTRNKKSMAVDLTTPGGRQILHRLVAKSDVLLTTFNAEQTEAQTVAGD